MTYRGIAVTPSLLAQAKRENYVFRNTVGDSTVCLRVLSGAKYKFLCVLSEFFDDGREEFTMVSLYFLGDKNHVHEHACVHGGVQLNWRSA